MVVDDDPDPSGTSLIGELWAAAAEVDRSGRGPIAAWLNADGADGSDLGTQTLFVKIGEHLSLRRCHFMVYDGFRRFCRGLRVLRLPFFPDPLDERFVAQRVAAFGGVADSPDQGGLQ
ncbi:MAG: hypothetical protein KJZ84_16465 [Bryobacteraceae bacterium]|nr:hypothetical protein [Bryobacteraceae bacterium]